MIMKKKELKAEIKRPNKKDFDFNDIFESAKFGFLMCQYADDLEAEIERLRKNIEDLEKIKL